MKSVSQTKCTRDGRTDRRVVMRSRYAACNGAEEALQHEVGGGCRVCLQAAFLTELHNIGYGANTSPGLGDLFPPCSL
jgi:hypothetical protein